MFPYGDNEWEFKENKQKYLPNSLFPYGSPEKP